jgi:hypothetical protein
MGEMRNLFSILVGEPEGKRQLAKRRRRWENNIRMDLREVGWRVWTGFIWLRVGTSGGSL